MRILLIGCGRWGQNWAKTLQSLGALAGIVEPSQALQKKLADTFPNTPCYASLEPAFSECEFSGAVVATPAPTHVKVGETLLRAGKSVLIEKPLTLTLTEAEHLLAVAKETNQVLAVGHVLMYHTGMQRLKQLIEAGELGEIRAIHCTRVNLGTFRNEEDIWWSFAPHDLSLLFWFLGTDQLSIQSVTAMPLVGRQEIPDTVMATFQTKKGQSASIHTSWYAPIKRHETVVIGSKKIAVLDDTLPADQKLKLLPYDLSLEGDQVTNLTKGDWETVPILDATPPLTGEAQAFLNVLGHSFEVGVAQLANNALQGVQVVKTLEAVSNRYGYALDSIQQEVCLR